MFEVVRYLVEHRDRMVPKEELLEQVWGTRFVSESALTSRIKAARRALGDDGREQRIIRTVHGRGYRFVAPLDADEDRRGRRHESGVAGSYRCSSARRRSSVLQEAAADAASGSGRVVLVFGEAGIGKTSLVRAFLAANAGRARARRHVRRPRDTAAPRPVPRHRQP